MKIAKLISIHEKNRTQNSLPGNLGDGYLLKHNGLYRSIRKQALKMGYRFTSKRFYNYDVLALTQLPRILEKKTVPYSDNAAAVKEIESITPRYFSLVDIPPLRANYVLHEAAHGIARTLREKIIGKKWPGTRLAQERHLALVLMMEEAFANACETFSHLDCDSQVHQLYLSLNVYIFESPEALKNLFQCVHRVGPKITFKVVYLSFLFANCLREKFTQAEFNRVLDLAIPAEERNALNLLPADIKLLKRVFKAGLDLDSDFTKRTNKFCLRHLGIQTELPKLFDFDFLEILEMKSQYVELIEAITQIAVE